MRNENLMTVQTHSSERILRGTYSRVNVIKKLIFYAVVFVFVMFFGTEVYAEEGSGDELLNVSDDPNVSIDWELDNDSELAYLPYIPLFTYKYKEMSYPDEDKYAPNKVTATLDGEDISDKLKLIDPDDFSTTRFCYIQNLNKLGELVVNVTYLDDNDTYTTDTLTVTIIKRDITDVVAWNFEDGKVLTYEEYKGYDSVYNDLISFEACFLSTFIHQDRANFYDVDYATFPYSLYFNDVKILEAQYDEYYDKYRIRTTEESKSVEDELIVGVSDTGLNFFSKLGVFMHNGSEVNQLDTDVYFLKTIWPDVQKTYTFEVVLENTELYYFSKTNKRTITLGGSKTGDVIDNNTKKQGEIKINNEKRAVGYEEVSGKNIYKIISNDSMVVSVVGTTDKVKVTIPETVTINGYEYKVTEVSANAFKNNKKIRSVALPGSVTKIGKNAFKGAKKLKTITIKSSKVSIGKNAFKGINKKATFKVPKKSYKKLVKAIKKSKTGWKKTMRIKKVK